MLEILTDINCRRDEGLGEIACRTVRIDLYGCNGLWQLGMMQSVHAGYGPHVKGCWRAC